MNRQIFMRLASITACTSFPLISEVRQRIGKEATGTQIFDKMLSFSDGRDILGRQYTPVKIQVIGVGNAGCNVVDKLIRRGINGVEFIIASNDAAVLARNSSNHLRCFRKHAGALSLGTVRHGKFYTSIISCCEAGRQSAMRFL